MSQLSKNLGASTSWSPKGLPRPVMGLLYLYPYICFDNKVSSSRGSSQSNTRLSHQAICLKDQTLKTKTGKFHTHTLQYYDVKILKVVNSHSWCLYLFMVMWTVHTSICIHQKWILSCYSIDCALCGVVYCSTPLHTMPLNNSWCNSLQWARASSFLRLHDHKEGQLMLENSADDVP
jgi:hypothetical protein